MAITCMRYSILSLIIKRGYFPKNCEHLQVRLIVQKVEIASIWYGSKYEHGNYVAIGLYPVAFFGVLDALKGANEVDAEDD